MQSTQPSSVTSEESSTMSSAAENQPRSYRDRLMRLYKVYAPEKLTTVDTALFAFRGREDQMISIATSKYGPEPSDIFYNLVVGAQSNDDSHESDSSTSTPPGGACQSHISAPAPQKQHPQALSYSERLMRLFQRYCPEQMLKFDDVLYAYRNNQQQMIDDFVQEFGPEPELEQRRERLDRFYRYYCPDKLLAIDRIMMAYASDTDEKLFDDLVRKYGPEPQDNDGAGGSFMTGTSHNTLEEVVARLSSYYRVYCPQKLPLVDSLAATYMMHPSGVTRLFQLLEQKYGPEPPLTDDCRESSQGPEEEPIKHEKEDGGSQNEESAMTVVDRLFRATLFYEPSKLSQLYAVMPTLSDESAAMELHRIVDENGPEPSRDALMDMHRLICSKEAGEAFARAQRAAGVVQRQELPRQASLSHESLSKEAASLQDLEPQQQTELSHALSPVGVFPFSLYLCYMDERERGNFQHTTWSEWIAEVIPSAQDLSTRTRSFLASLGDTHVDPHADVVHSTTAAAAGGSVEHDAGDRRCAAIRLAESLAKLHATVIETASDSCPSRTINDSMASSSSSIISSRTAALADNQHHRGYHGCGWWRQEPLLNSIFIPTPPLMIAPTLSWIPTELRRQCFSDVVAFVYRFYMPHAPVIIECILRWAYIVGVKDDAHQSGDQDDSVPVAPTAMFSALLLQSHPHQVSQSPALTSSLPLSHLKKCCTIWWRGSTEDNCEYHHTVVSLLHQVCVGLRLPGFDEGDDSSALVDGKDQQGKDHTSVSHLLSESGCLEIRALAFVINVSLLESVERRQRVRLCDEARDVSCPSMNELEEEQRRSIMTAFAEGIVRIVAEEQGVLLIHAETRIREGIDSEENYQRVNILMNWSRLSYHADMPASSPWQQLLSQAVLQLDSGGSNFTTSASPTSTTALRQQQQLRWSHHEPLVHRVQQQWVAFTKPIYDEEHVDVTKIGLQRRTPTSRRVLAASSRPSASKKYYSVPTFGPSTTKERKVEPNGSFLHSAECHLSCEARVGLEGLDVMAAEKLQRYRKAKRQQQASTTLTSTSQPRSSTSPSRPHTKRNEEKVSEVRDAYQVVRFEGLLRKSSTTSPSRQPPRSSEACPPPTSLSPRNADVVSPRRHHGHTLPFRSAVTPKGQFSLFAHF